jgi:hypothetical protein
MMRIFKLYITAFLISVVPVFAQPAAKVDKKYGTRITVVPAKPVPVWAKAAPVNVNYYYLPDIQTYYDVPAKRYIYLNNGSWVRTSALPARYKGYNLYNSNPVFLKDYKGNSPYTLYKVHKVKYKGNGKWKPVHHDRKERKHHDSDNDHGKRHGKKD